MAKSLQDVPLGRLKSTLANLHIFFSCGITIASALFTTVGETILTLAANK